MPDENPKLKVLISFSRDDLDVVDVVDAALRLDEFETIPQSNLFQESDLLG